MTHERKGSFLEHGKVWLYRGEKEQWEEECEKMRKEVVLRKKNVGENEFYLMRLKGLSRLDKLSLAF